MDDVHISLLDLSKQLPFEIDEKLKKELCFTETLVISCGHDQGNLGDESSDSEWSCSESTESEKSVEIKDEEPFEIKDHVEEEAVAPVEEEEEKDFYFYFFPDCTKPVKRTQDSKDSLIIVDGIPTINKNKKVEIICSCEIDKKTGKCSCFTKLPCKCGAKVANECTCAKLEEICICHSTVPFPVCTCKPSEICTCSPSGHIHPECLICKEVKPCICDRDKYPFPVCGCPHKPIFDKGNDEKVLEEIQEEIVDEQQPIGNETQPAEQIDPQSIPCECQKPSEKPPGYCRCLKGIDCICKEICICDVKKSCICSGTPSQEIPCKDDDSKSVCICPLPRDCTCGAGTPDDCKCFRIINNCTCGDPDNCKCQHICDCRDPCICDTKYNVEECICLDKAKKGEKVECTCLKKVDEGRKLKRVRAGKQGYRWCHDIDPHHTFFDYGYGRHDKISYKEEVQEKVNILGLHDEVVEEGVCAVHGVTAPPYEKKARKPSIDCCSAVGGLSVCVETLGEDKDKFLVQVVSHSSKEGAKTGSKLVSILDCNLHTMEENRIEHLSKKEIVKERRSYMAVCENGYYNKVTRICGDKHVVKRNYYSFEQAKNLLLEGANVVLLRYFALSRYRGTIKTETVMMDGSICESIYVAAGVSQAIVNGKPLFVVKVERHIIEPCGYIHQMLTVLTLRGYLVSHEWASNSYVLHLNPLLRIVPEKDEIEPHAALRENWREDLQLLSDYLDFKSLRSSEGARYVTENGTLTGTVRDYLQALLLLKPQDALHFTKHYFGAALSALDLPHDEYFEPSGKHVIYFFYEE